VFGAPAMLARVAIIAVFALSSASAAEPVDYLRDVKPILARQCVMCHGPDKQRSGLRLDAAALIRKGANSGQVIVPGKSGESRLLHAITWTPAAPKMPDGGDKLSDGDIAKLRAWID